MFVSETMDRILGPFGSAITDGKGLVIIDDESHPWVGLRPEEISSDVYGGITISEKLDASSVKYYKLGKSHIGSWIVGFSTFHYGAVPTPEWTREQIIAHTKVTILKEAEKAKELAEQKTKAGIDGYSNELTRLKEKYPLAVVVGCYGVTTPQQLFKKMHKRSTESWSTVCTSINGIVMMVTPKDDETTFMNAYTELLEKQRGLPKT